MNLRQGFPLSDAADLGDGLQEASLAFLEHAPAAVVAVLESAYRYLKVSTVRAIRHAEQRRSRFLELPRSPEEEESLLSLALSADDNEAFARAESEVETLLAPLSPLLAETVRRHVLEGYTVEEISVQAGVPIETIRKRRTRAYATLRQRLEAWAKRHHQ